MAKVTVAISIDLEHLELLTEIKSKYHLKNHSQAIRTIIKQWQMFIEERKIITTAPKEKPQIPQRSTGIPPLDPKYQMKKVKA
jgi:hypothetical protein